MEGKTTMRAIRTGTSLGHAELLDDVPIPSALTTLAQHPAHVLLKPSYVGINPCDYLFTDLEIMFAPGMTIGCEYAGEVIEVGSAVTIGLKKGDRIAGLAMPSAGPQPNAGTFAEYVLVKGDAALRLEEMGDAISEAESAGVNVALATVCYAFYHLMGLPLPVVDPGLEPLLLGNNITRTSERTILIYGGSTTTGLMAIQWAKLSGMLVITTCSAANFELVKKMGADHAFDYHDAKVCAERIRKVTDGHLRLVFDCVGAFASPQICADAMALDGGGCLYNSLSPTPFTRQDVKSIFTGGEAVLGEARRVRGELIPGDEELFKAYRDFLRLSQHLFRVGKIRAPPTEIVHGMENILDVMDDLRKWNIRGKKMVARI
ncbi:hypothetical protein KVR01_007481 [Diaporthe batatas]|uniref:uncharacterized protein n=1 Tax=Diaporthe batatas TaxID=748121 RepID=UPI001D05884C|nr:uncharacterized protein KVR01_007481 [Diaporthe batatas]KAG8163003.1 hypothetical protein KVR01_007481 [Diaporthe batatas]